MFMNLEIMRERKKRRHSTKTPHVVQWKEKKIKNAAIFSPSRTSRLAFVLNTLMVARQRISNPLRRLLYQWLSSQQVSWCRQLAFLIPASPGKKVRTKAFPTPNLYYSRVFMYLNTRFDHFRVCSPMATSSQTQHEYKFSISFHVVHDGTIQSF